MQGKSKHGSVRLAGLAGARLYFLERRCHGNWSDSFCCKIHSKHTLIKLLRRYRKESSKLIVRTAQVLPLLLSLFSLPPWGWGEEALLGQAACTCWPQLGLSSSLLLLELVITNFRWFGCSEKLLWAPCVSLCFEALQRGRASW